MMEVQLCAWPATIHMRYMTQIGIYIVVQVEEAEIQHIQVLYLSNIQQENGNQVH